GGKMEGRGQGGDHVGGGGGTAHLQETQMPLRDLRTLGEIKLRPAATLPPPSQRRGKALLTRHEYLPSSCGHDAEQENATSLFVTAGGGVGTRGPDRNCLKRPWGEGGGGRGGGGRALSWQGCGPTHAAHSGRGHGFSLGAAAGVVSGQAMPPPPGLARRCRIGDLFLRTVFHLLQYRHWLHDRGPRK